MYAKHYLADTTLDENIAFGVGMRYRLSAGSSCSRVRRKLPISSTSGAHGYDARVGERGGAYPRPASSASASLAALYKEASVWSG